MYAIQHTLTLEILHTFLRVIEDPQVPLDLLEDIPQDTAAWAFDALDATFQYLGGTDTLTDAIKARAITAGEIREIILLTISTFTLLGASNASHA